MTYKMSDVTKLLFLIPENTLHLFGFVLSSLASSFTYSYITAGQFTLVTFELHLDFATKLTTCQSVLILLKIAMCVRIQLQQAAS